jgi:hypothetical protein
MTAVILQFPWLGKPLLKDGGRARIRSRRRIIFQQEQVDDHNLVMLQADVVDTRPSEIA